MKYLALASLLLLSCSTQAVTLIFDDADMLIGVSGLEVDSTTYDVEFADGSCVDAFGECVATNFTFSTQRDAAAASQVLFDQLLLTEAFVDIILTRGPEAISGCMMTAICSVYTPYQTQGDTVSVVSGNLFGGRDFVSQPLSVFAPLITRSAPVWTYTRWTLSEDTSIAALPIDLVSRAQGEILPVSGPSEETANPSVSGNGRYVAFSSLAPNLQTGVNNNNFVGIFVYDRDTDTTESLTPAGNATSADPSISADGRFVAFESAATNLVAGDEARSRPKIFVYDRDTDTTELLTPGLTSGFASDPSISADGRFVAFESNSSQLNAGGGGLLQEIFVYDRSNDTIEQLTTGTNNTSTSPSISGDGRYVAYSSASNTLVPGDINQQTDIFVYDRDTGSTERLTPGANGRSAGPVISGDGQFVAFFSDASNLVAGDTNGDTRDVFVHDRNSGTTELITVGGNGLSTLPSISADGRLVSFSSIANNLVPGDTDGFRDIFVYDRNTQTLEQITEGANESSVDSSISADGGFVGFITSANNLVTPNPNNRNTAVLYDRIAAKFERVPSNIEFERSSGNDGSTTPSVSDNGQFVAFASAASNLVDGDNNGSSDIFVYSRETPNNVLITPGANGDSFNPSISADGRFVAFESAASNLVPGDTNGVTDIFIYDRATANTELITFAGNENSTNASISGDGRFVAFESLARNLAPGDNNGTTDVYVYDRETNTTQLLTPGANGASNAPSISRDGRFVAFSSIATNLLGGDGLLSVFHIFVYDRLANSTEQLTENSGINFFTPGGDGWSTEPAISANGRFVAFQSFAANLVEDDINGGNIDVFIHDREMSTTIIVPPAEPIAIQRFGNSGASISADGRFVAFETDSPNLVAGDFNNAFDLFVYDQVTGATRPLTSGSDGASTAASISGNGRVVAFSSEAFNLDNNGTNTADIFVYTAGGQPSADALAVTTTEDTPLAVSVTGFDPESDALTFSVVTLPANGELSGTAPDLVYTPNADFFGIDEFTFNVDDGSGSSLPATVSITVTAVNDAPIGTGIAGGEGVTTLSTPRDTPFTITLEGSDADGDSLTFNFVALPANGGLTGEAPNLVYVPDDGFTGSDSFTFTVSDGQETSEPVTVTIAVEDTTVTLLSAVLPSSRSVEVGTVATAFATLINTGTADALSCGLQLPDTLSAEFFYQATDPETNEAVGQPNLSVDIAAGTSRSFVFGITPTAELSASEVAMQFQCVNANQDAASIVGLNTLLLSATLTPAPDLIALVATTTNNGVMELENSSGFFTAATINVGSTGTISVSADTGDATLPITLSLCQTDPATSVCINPTAPNTAPVIVEIEEGGTPTFAVFASATDTIALDPANTRVFLRFSDNQDQVRGATSVAVQNTE